MIRNNLRYILLFVLSVLIQTLLFDRVYFTGYINVFVYILFILLLPAETNKSLVMFLGFLIGFSVDIANSTPGLHAAATVLLCFVRPFFLRIYSPRDGYDSNKFPSIKNNGLVWFLKYAISLILVHHTFLLFVEAWGFTGFFFTIGKIALSSIFSLLFIIMGHLLIMRD